MSLKNTGQKQLWAKIIEKKNMYRRAFDYINMNGSEIENQVSDKMLLGVLGT